VAASIWSAVKDKEHGGSEPTKEALLKKTKDVRDLVRRLTLSPAPEAAHRSRAKETPVPGPLLIGRSPDWFELLLAPIERPARQGMFQSGTVASLRQAHGLLGVLYLRLRSDHRCSAVFRFKYACETSEITVNCVAVNPALAASRLPLACLMLRPSALSRRRERHGHSKMKPSASGDILAPFPLHPGSRQEMARFHFEPR